MPRGFAGIREAADKINAARERAANQEDFQPILWFKLPKSGDSAIIRPLEEGEDVAYAAVHELQIPTLKYPINIVCVNQKNDDTDCPGCEAGLKRKMQGWLNVIWRNAPVYELTEDGRKYDTSKPTGESKDQVALLSSGVNMFTRWDELDEDNDGITSRDFTIKRSGTGTSTTYKITPVKTGGKNKAVALSAADKKLLASKPDLNPFINVPTYNELLERINGNGRGGNSEPSEEAPDVPKSPWGKKSNIFG